MPRRRCSRREGLAGCAPGASRNADSGCAGVWGRCASLRFSRDHPPRLVSAWSDRMLGFNPHKSDSASIDGSKPAVVKLIATGVIESVRAVQHEGLGEGRACPGRLAPHSQPSVHRAISDLVIGPPLAFAIENIDCAPHIKTVRAYSIPVSSEKYSGGCMPPAEGCKCLRFSRQRCRNADGGSIELHGIE